MSESARPLALLVGGPEQERDRWMAALADRVDTEAVADGSTALARLDDAVEVLLVHRDLPDRGAAALVAAVRDRDVTVRAALLTPEPPEPDVVGQGFDAWLATPVGAELLVETVEGLLACRRYDRAIDALYDLATQRADGDDEAAARERLHTVRSEADAALAAVETIDRRALLANSPAAFSEPPQ